MYLCMAWQGMAWHGMAWMYVCMYIPIQLILTVDISAKHLLIEAIDQQKCTWPQSALDVPFVSDKTPISCSNHHSSW